MGRSSTFHPRGGTLLEVLLCVVIIGVAITAAMQMLTTGTVANAKVAESNAAMNLAHVGHEWAVSKGFEYLKDHVVAAPVSFSPVVNAQEQAVSGFDGWSQTITGQFVNEKALQSADMTGTNTALWVTVSVAHNGSTVYSSSHLYMQ